MKQWTLPDQGLFLALCREPCTPARNRAGRCHPVTARRPRPRFPQGSFFLRVRPRPQEAPLWQRVALVVVLHRRQMSQSASHALPRHSVPAAPLLYTKVPKLEVGQVFHYCTVWCLCVRLPLSSQTSPDVHEDYIWNHERVIVPNVPADAGISWQDMQDTMCVVSWEILCFFPGGT